MTSTLHAHRPTNGLGTFTKRFYSLALAMFCLWNTAYANNIEVTSLRLGTKDNTANTVMVNFNLTWENSWRTSTGSSNWDAAWVFVKFMVGASDPTFTGVSSSGTSVTVTSTANLRVGMPVRVTSGTGAFAANTVISSITNATTFVVSVTPTTNLSGASIECKRIWEHARLDESGHVAASGSSITTGLLTPGSAYNATSNPALGVFIGRSANGSGNNTFNNTGLRWHYGGNGIAYNAQITVKVFAIEMVYVPLGSFNVGGGGGVFAFTSTTINTATATTAPSGTGTLGGQAGGYPTGETAPANSTWPNGFNAFYSMKYEISQGQYKDFLNTLTYAQQGNRTETAPNSAAGTGAISSTNLNRNGLDIQTPGNATTLLPAVYGCNLDADANYNETVDGEWIACNFLTWTDGAAYMDWAGLRPMTELEFEKACRGNQAAVSGEYAWGNTTTTSANNITNGGQTGEVTNTANANSASANQGNVQGPLRVGAFAGAATSRAQAGATYYGIMEMSGNLWERAVTVGHADGRAYTGTHGDGSLSNIGHANTTAWPGLVSGEVTGANGSGFRGGVWYNGVSDMRVSDRIYATASANTRLNEYGFRGVRTAQ